MSMRKLEGKYRAIVSNVKDPKRRGRIRVMCPTVTGKYESAWCEPNFPYACEGDGDFYLPKKGDVVNVEFRDGHPNKPVWSGSWHTEGGVPIGDYDNTCDKVRVISFMGSVIRMTGGGITISAGGCELNLSGGVVTIKAGNMTVQSSGNVDINAGGNTVVNSGGNTAVMAGGACMAVGVGSASLESGGSTKVEGSAISVAGSGAVTISGASIDMN